MDGFSRLQSTLPFSFTLRRKLADWSPRTHLVIQISTLYNYTILALNFPMYIIITPFSTSIQIKL
jgi:hypothetical protein